MASFTFFKKKQDQSRLPNDHDYFTSTIITAESTPELDEEKALKIPAVKSAIELIGSSISQLPINLLIEEDLGITRVEDERSFMINQEPNLHDNGQVIKKKIVQDYLLHGKCYLYVRNGKLFHLEAKNIQVEKYTDDGFTLGERKFIYHGNKDVVLYEHEVIVIDSGTNGLLVDAGIIFNTAFEQMTYQHSVMRNGGLPLGLLKATSRLTETVIGRLRNSFNDMYSGSKNAGKTLILEEGLDYQALGLKPDEVGLHESNKHIISEIARVFNVPQSMIDSSANKYASLDQNTEQYLKTTLTPIISAIEESFDRKLLTRQEKMSGYFFRFDTSELMRTTEEMKVKTTAEAFQKGLISFNQAAYRLDLPKAEKDYHLFSIGTAVKYDDGTWMFPNLGPQQTTTEVTTTDEDGIKEQ